MSDGLMKMWIALFAIGLMFVAVLSIQFSRFKLKGVWRVLTAIVAYSCMIIAGILIVFVVFSGPVKG
jgi:Kef-type K+ transport system membrane component KefB